MRVPGQLELAGQSTQRFDLFVRMLNKMWQQLAGIVNGHLRVCTGEPLVPGTPIHCENLDAVCLVTPNPVVANVDTTLKHNLGRVPDGYIVVRQVPTVLNTPGIAYDGTVAWTDTDITLKFTTAGQYWLVVL